MAGLEVDDSFLETFHLLGTNSHYVIPDVEFDSEVKRTCEQLITKLNNKAEELKARENGLEKAQMLFNEKIKNINERMQQYQKTLNSNYESKCKILEEKQLKLDNMREELEKRIQERIPKDDRPPGSKKSDEIQSIIKLSVGGKKFTTSLNTLCKDHNSMMAAMFSGRHNLYQVEDGSYFIDRDGTYFEYILNYLRGGIVSLRDLPEDQTTLSALRREADYYQIRGFTEIIEECLENSIDKLDYTQEEIVNMLLPIVRDGDNNFSSDFSDQSESLHSNYSLNRTHVSQGMTNCKLNFINKKLNGISFAHTTFFHDVSFRNACLVGASFYGCEFGVGVVINFNDSDLSQCDFRQCKGKENGAKMNFAHGGGLLSASSSETFLQMIQQGKISFKRARIENALFDPKVSDYLNHV